MSLPTITTDERRAMTTAIAAVREANPDATVSYIAARTKLPRDRVRDILGDMK